MLFLEGFIWYNIYVLILFLVISALALHLSMLGMGVDDAGMQDNKIIKPVEETKSKEERIKKLLSKVDKPVSIGEKEAWIKEIKAELV